MEKMATGTKVKWLITLLVTLALALIPTGDVLTVQMKWFFVVTAFNILLLAFSLLPLIVPAVLLPLGYWIFSVAEPGVIYGAWSNQITWVVLGGLIFAVMMGKSGLSKRIAYKCMLLAKGNFVALMFIMIIPGIIIAPFVPAAVARCAIFGAIMVSLCQAMGYKPNSPKAVTAFIVGYIVSSNTSWLFYTGSNANLIACGFLESVGISVSFGSYFVANFLPVLVWLVTSVALVVFLNRDKEKEDRAAIQAHVREQYQELGPMSRDEKKMAVLMSIVMILLLTTNYHPLNAGMIFCLAVIVGFLPGIELADEKDLGKVNFTMVFVVTACVAIGDVAASLGLGDILIDLLMPYAPESLSSLSIFLWIIVFLGNFLMTPLAIVSSLSVPVISIAQIVGLNPEAIIYIFLFSSNAIVLPYEIAASLVLFGFGMMDTKNFAKNMLVVGAWSLVCILLVMVPWFKLIGLV